MNKTLNAAAAERRIAEAKARARNPVTSIRAKCIDCTGGELATVRECTFTGCGLYPYRFGGDPYRGKPKPPDYLPVMKAIRAECLSCNGSAYEVRMCPATDCALYPLRLGKNPFRAEKRHECGQSSAELLVGVGG